MAKFKAFDLVLKLWLEPNMMLSLETECFAKARRHYNIDQYCFDITFNAPIKPKCQNFH